MPLAAVAMLEPGARVALPAQGLEGRVLRVGQSADPATQSVLAVAEVRGPNGRLRPGQAISATVSVATNGAPQWRVPAGSVVRHRERQWVFLRTPAGFEARPITLVTETAQSVSIRGDLPPGAQVAMRGVLPLIAALAAGDQD